MCTGEFDAGLDASLGRNIPTNCSPKLPSRDGHRFHSPRPNHRQRFPAISRPDTNRRHRPDFVGARLDETAAAAALEATDRRGAFRVRRRQWLCRDDGAAREDELVTCYDALTGAVKWSHGIQARHQTPMGRIGPRSTPTINEGRVYALGATGILRCLTAPMASRFGRTTFWPNAARTSKKI